MDRRKGDRSSRRVSVRYWEKGERKERVGHTLNISQSGMFVGTDRPPKAGTRVRVEISDPESGFVVEGVVAHSHTVAAELRKIREPGMGIRFLTPQELVAPVIKKPEAAAAAGNGPAGAAEEPTSYPVRFESSWQFLRVLEQDIRHGGLFVATPRLASLNQVIPLELHVPGLGEPIHLPARVVHCFDPAQHGVRSGRRLAGMGVEFIDRGAAVAQLEAVAKRLRQ